MQVIIGSFNPSNPGETPRSRDLCAIHAKRVTILPRDMQLARRLRGEDTQLGRRIRGNDRN